MAYVSKETKATLVAEAKKVIPKDWKVTFSVRHHSTIIATIQQAPKSVLDDYLEPLAEGERPYINIYYIDRTFKGATLEILQKLYRALNVGNYDNSDPMTDYFDTGWYSEINFGRWNKAPIFI